MYLFNSSTHKSRIMTNLAKYNLGRVLGYGLVAIVATFILAAVICIISFGFMELADKLN